jgi:hypothetical protein
MEHINITSGGTLIYCRNIKAKATNVIVMLRSLQNERGKKLRPSKNNCLVRDIINNPAHYQCLLSHILHSNQPSTNACGLRNSTQPRRGSEQVQFYLHSTIHFYGEAFNSAHGQL